MSAHRALDFTFDLAVEDEPLRHALLTGLEPLHVDDASPEHCIGVVEAHDRYELREDGHLITNVSSTGVVLARVFEHINQRAGGMLRDQIPMHAAAVAHPTGPVVALAGSSGAGKSTLGFATIRSGWGFVAEEISAVDPTTLALRSFHRPIGLRRGGTEALGMAYPDDAVYELVHPVPVEQQHRRAGGELAAIVIVDRRKPGSGKAEPLGPAQALAELVEHCAVRDDDRIVHVFRQLDSLVRTVPTYRLSYGKPDEGVDALEELASTMES